MYMQANPDLPFLYGHGERHSGSERGGRAADSLSRLQRESGGAECGEKYPPRLSCRLRPAGDATGLFAHLLIKLGRHAERRESSEFTCVRREIGKAEGAETNAPQSAGLRYAGRRGRPEFTFSTEILEFHEKKSGT